MKGILVLIIIMISGCASLFKPPERYLEGGNTVYSSGQPSVRVQVDKSIPFVGTDTLSDYIKYDSDVGGSSAKHQMFVFATRNSKLLDRSVEVYFSKFPRHSYWIKGYDEEYAFMTGVKKYPIGTFYTGIYQYYPDDGELAEGILERSDIYPSPCRIAKGYMHVVTGMNNAKISIVYSEKAGCKELGRMSNEFGLTSAGKAFLEQFSKRADNAFEVLEPERS